MARPFVDYINRGDESEAALENLRGNDCRSLLLFQKYNILYQKYPEDDEIRNTRINQKTKEYLECHPSSLFYDETSLHSSPTNSYGLDSKIIERSPLTTTTETKLLPLESKLPALPRF